jgi:hypothetical protein
LSSFRSPSVARSTRRPLSDGPYSLDVELLAYLLVPDYTSFLEVQEGLLLRIMQAVPEAGTGLALQSQTVYVNRDARPGSAPA